jgi:hypothetical protein
MQQAQMMEMAQKLGTPAINAAQEQYMAAQEQEQPQTE